MNVFNKRNGSGWWGWALAGGVVGFVAGRRVAARGRIRHLEAWQRALAETRSEVEAAMLAGRVQVRFEKLYAERPRFAHHALRDHLENNVLPGLALYQTLLETLDQEAALAEVERLFTASFGRVAKWVPYLVHVPHLFALRGAALRVFHLVAGPVWPAGCPARRGRGRAATIPHRAGGTAGRRAGQLGAPVPAAGLYQRDV